ncbi:Archaeal ATPase [Tractidigestivibacter scatoligenes]|uniref:Archaeal ATPase n=1 Tax=Tractidigestivibacter scatoligenes TaxID=1299998 RepID=A0A100YXI7_TRASO|nr:ATP-binding protein [Tractidigestivibacter scatoligenes]KUH59490.1 Archaeal ATPase [Tractidigestivibacter scatoligenes]
MPPINPFTPEFGSVPLVMAGRQSIRRELFDAFVQGRGNPNLSSILVGPRGSGKTALLTYLGKEASAQGWIAVHSVAMPGMLEDIYEQTLLASADVLGEGKAKSLRLTGIGVGPVSASWEAAPAPSENWRTRMGRLLSTIEDAGHGLLITVDEVVATLDEMVTLAAVYQLFVREQRRVALVMAGLPHNISALLNDKSVSFLRRAQRHTLGTIPDADVREAFKETAAIGGKDVTDDALEACVRAIGGFPYMLQLVGFRCWQATSTDDVISAQEARRGIQDAQEDFRAHILAPTLRELSEIDLQFVEAMLEDERESRISDIAKRMGVESRYASKYRSRLLAEGVIEQVARGVVRFALPEFRAFVREELGA